MGLPRAEPIGTSGGRAANQKAPRRKDQNRPQRGAPLQRVPFCLTQSL